MLVFSESSTQRNANNLATLPWATEVSFDHLFPPGVEPYVYTPVQVESHEGNAGME